VIRYIKGCVKKMAEKLKFYDLAAKKSFTTDKYKIVTKNGRKRAIAISPSGNKACRFLASKKK